MLGGAFKRDVDDARYSPALKVIDLLHRRKVDRSCFDYAAIVRSARMVFDVRNATRHVADGREKIIRL